MDSFECTLANTMSSRSIVRALIQAPSPVMSTDAGQDPNGVRPSRSSSIRSTMPYRPVTARWPPLK